jgi:hypothetical protein
MNRMKILIGYDGSACAESALADLKRAGMPRKAEVVVLSEGNGSGRKDLDRQRVIGGRGARSLLG